MKYYVYILRSLVNQSLYKGMTNDLKKRVKQHNDGKCKSTASKRPLKLVYFEAVDNRLEARKREKYFKSGEGREFLKKIVK